MISQLLHFFTNSFTYFLFVKKILVSVHCFYYLAHLSFLYPLSHFVIPVIRCKDFLREASTVSIVVTYFYTHCKGIVASAGIQM